MEANLTPRRVMIVNYNTLHCTDKNIAYSMTLDITIYDHCPARTNFAKLFRRLMGPCVQNLTNYHRA